jgi:arginase family enzyme
LKESFLKSANNGNADFHFTIDWHPEGSPAIECPPQTTAKVPVLDVGSLHNHEEVFDFEKACLRDSDFYKAVSASASALSEKGYIPCCVGDSGNATLAMLEGLRQVGHDNICVVSFSADTKLGTADAPLKRAMERKFIKGIMQFGCRTVTSASRKLRKDYEVRYADAYGLHERGVFTLRDIRNSYPIYLSVDLSVLETCFAPGVQNPEAGGLSIRELIHLISVIRAPAIVGMDIHGLDPELDIYRGRNGQGEGITAIGGAKILKEMLVKAVVCHTKTRMQIEEYLKQEQVQGRELPKYPEH